MKRAEVIGNRIAELRLKNGYTRKELADILGVTRSAVSNYEYGMKIPNDINKIKISQLFNEPVEELFFFDRFEKILGKEMK